MGLSLLDGASPPAAGWVLLAEGIQYETVRLCQVSHKHRRSLSQSKSRQGYIPDIVLRIVQIRGTRL